MRCPTRRSTRTTRTSRRSAPTGPAQWRRPISTGARSRSTAARTRSRRTSSRRRFWGCESANCEWRMASVFSLDSPFATRHSQIRDSDGMDFDLSEEQRLLKDSVERLVADRYDFESRKGYQAEPDGFSRELWVQYAELGLLGLPFSEEQGGFGGGAVETMIVMEALGRALALEPYLATVVLGVGFLRHGASAAQQAELIPQIAAGELTLAFAHTERQSRFDLFDIETRARRDGSGFVLEGDKGVVLHGDSAEKLIVTARTAGGRRDRSGIGLFLVDAKSPGVSRRGYPTQDGLRAAENSLGSVRAGPDAVIGDPENGLPVIERVVDEAIAALCAEAIGCMGEM